MEAVLLSATAAAAICRQEVKRRHRGICFRMHLPHREVPLGFSAVHAQHVNAAGVKTIPFLPSTVPSAARSPSSMLPNALARGLARPVLTSGVRQQLAAVTGGAGLPSYGSQSLCSGSYSSRQATKSVGSSVAGESLQTDGTSPPIPYKASRRCCNCMRMCGEQEGSSLGRLQSIWNYVG